MRQKPFDDIINMMAVGLQIAWYNLIAGLADYQVADLFLAGYLFWEFWYGSDQLSPGES